MKIESNGLILLFTSNWEALYAQDAIDVIAKPEKGLVHFRYRHDWIEKTLLSKIQRDGAPSIFVGRRVLCVFVDRTIHSDVPILVPTRYGTIQSAETEGSIEHIFFTVGRYFSWQSFSNQYPGFGTADDFKGIINAFRQLVHADLNLGVDAGSDLPGPPDKFVVEVRQPKAEAKSPYFHESKPEEESSDFEKVTGALHSLPYFQDTVFFRIKSMEEFFSRWEYLQIFPLPFVSKARFERNNAKAIGVRKLGGNKYGIRFRRVAPYRLKIAIVNGKRLTPAMKRTSLEVKTDPKQATPEVSFLRVSAKSDFVRLLLFPEFQASDVISQIAIEAVDRERSPALTKVDDGKRKEWQDEWLDAGDRSWIKMRNKRRARTGKRMSDAYPESVSLIGPRVVLEFESTHSSFYLRVGGLMLLAGYVLHFMLNEEWLTVIRNASPAWMESFYQLGWVTLANGVIVARLAGLYLLYCAFTVATRKLPSIIK